MPRIKTPDKLKIIKGTDKKYRMTGTGLSMTVFSKVPPPPSWFTPLARKIYKDVSRELLAKNLLHEVGLTLLVSYCNLIALHLQLEEVMNLEGRMITVKSKEGSYEMASPKHKMSLDALEKARQIAVEYGFTPLSQQRIIHQVTQKDDNDKFFN
ncbi:MAG: phage terminase small subunit P27 family [Bacteroidota bacterium]